MSLQFVHRNKMQSRNRFEEHPQTSDVSRTKSHNLIFSRLVLQLFLSHPLNQGVKSKMKL